MKRLIVMLAALVVGGFISVFSGTAAQAANVPSAVVSSDVQAANTSVQKVGRRWRHRGPRFGIYFGPGYGYYGYRRRWHRRWRSHHRWGSGGYYRRRYYYDY